MKKFTINAANLPSARAYKVSRAALPADLPYADDYADFTEVHFLGKVGWMAKGHKQAPSQIVVWYPNKQMFSGFGNTYKEALELATARAWAYI